MYKVHIINLSLRSHLRGATSAFLPTHGTGDGSFPSIRCVVTISTHATAATVTWKTSGQTM
eukprot:2092033-Karenia_brevis.AAC.1